MRPRAEARGNTHGCRPTASPRSSFNEASRRSARKPWFRDFFVAPRLASMRPRAEARGNRGLARIWCAASGRFNEASSRSARKPGERDWLEAPDPAASMRPRAEARGNRAQRAVVLLLGLASMRPRAEARGNVHQLARALAALEASMRPRAEARGNLKRQSLFKHRCPRFNEASRRSARKPVAKDILVRLRAELQ